MLRGLSLCTALMAAIVFLPNSGSAREQYGYRNHDYSMRDRDYDRDWNRDMHGSRNHRGERYGWERGHHYGWSDHDRDRDDRYGRGRRDWDDRDNDRY